MKNLTINLNNHHAVLSFKKISNKQFETLKWKLIEKNIDEIFSHKYFTNDVSNPAAKSYPASEVD